MVVARCTGLAATSCGRRTSSNTVPVSPSSIRAFSSLSLTYSITGFFSSVSKSSLVSTISTPLLLMVMLALRGRLLTRASSPNRSPLPSAARVSCLLLSLRLTMALPVLMT